MEIYIARHGQNEDNKNGILNGHRDLPLTELGREQAQTAAVLIKERNLQFDVVLSSPLQRAFETAEIICEESGFETPEAHQLLIERNFGIMTGKPASSIKETCTPDVIETDTITYFLSPKDAETFPDLLRRARTLLNELSEKYDEESRILLVGHGDMGKMIYAEYYDLEWETVLTQFHFGNSEVLLLSPDSLAKDAHVFNITQANH